MKRKNIYFTVYVTTVSAFISILSYLSTSSLIFNKLIKIGLLDEKINIPLVQDYCLWIGIILSSFLLSLKLIITKIELNKTIEVRNALISMSKNLLTSSLGRKLLSNQSDYDIRIFIPKYPKIYKFLDLLHAEYKRLFIIKNIEMIATEGITKDLEFEVSPKQIGLVGICYNKKAMVYDDDLEHTNESDYGLNQIQVSRTFNLKWSICCPIFNEKNEVIAIIALDGKTRIKIDKQKAASIRQELFAYSRMLYDNVPQLFER